MRFVLDGDVQVAAIGVVASFDSSNQCWRAPDQFLRRDDDVAVYATDKGAVVISHDRAFAKRRKRQTIGQHIELRCSPVEGPGLLERDLAECMVYLTSMPDVVITLRPSSTPEVHPPQWT